MKTRSLFATLLLAACASPPRPALLSEADAVSKSASALEAKQLAPGAYLRGEKLRQEASAAADHGKTPLAEVRAERAIVAYSHGQILSRISKAEQRLVAAKAELYEAQTKATALEGRRVTVAAELTSLDNEVLVEQEAEAIADSKATTPDREAARKRAAKTALTQARLLCVTAQLLGADKAAVDGALQTVTTLEAQLDRNPSPMPLNESVKARSACQEQVTLVRRPARVAAPQSDAADRLYLSLSEAGHTPNRDERGIVVTLPTNVADATVRDLARLAVANEQTPLLVVVHRLKGEPSAKDATHAVAKLLTDAGVKTVHTESAGSRLPITQGLDPAKQKLNERTEVVFVTKI